jgi:hypothetical protein
MLVPMVVALRPQFPELIDDLRTDWVREYPARPSSG